MGRTCTRLVLAAMALATAPVAAHPAAARPSVVLVTLDTVRADHLGAYGYPRPTSPFLDGLARRGLLFTRAFAVTATTTPSHASIFTGLYPIQHRVRQNGDVLDAALFTLAEWMRIKQYDTAAFVATRGHFKRAGFAQGFALFDEPLADGRRYRPSTDTVDRAIGWLSRRARGTPYFLWLHLFDAHLPYDQANRFPVASPREGDELVAYLTGAQRVPLAFFGGDPARLLDMAAQYDGELRALDRDLRRLHEATAKDDAIWIVTSDHGEGLGSHMWMEHGKMLYNEQLRAVLIIDVPGDRFAARLVDCVVEHVDLLPTVAELLGAPMQKRAASIAGRSLVPIMSKPDCGSAPRLAFAQRRRFQRLPPADEEFEPGRKFALQDARYKYILWTEGPHELYDLTSDPYETTNLIGRGLPEETMLRRALLDKLDSLRPHTRRQAERVDAATEEELRALGYLP